MKKGVEKFLVSTKPLQLCIGADRALKLVSAAGEGYVGLCVYSVADSAVSYSLLGRFKALLTTVSELCSKLRPNEDSYHLQMVLINLRRSMASSNSPLDVATIRRTDLSRPSETTQNLTLIHPPNPTIHLRVQTMTQTN